MVQVLMAIEGDLLRQWQTAIITVRQEVTESQ